MTPEAKCKFCPMTAPWIETKIVTNLVDKIIQERPPGWGWIERALSDGLWCGTCDPRGNSSWEARKPQPSTALDDGLVTLKCINGHYTKATLIASISKPKHCNHCGGAWLDG